MSEGKTVALVANGALHNPDLLSIPIRQHQKIIAVDGGLYHLDKMGLTPDLIVGDLDSISDELLKRYANVPIHRLPIDKDETDLEVALRLTAQPDVARMTLYCVLEKRTDHALGNLHLLRRYPQRAFIETGIETIFDIVGTAVVKCKPGQTVSFIPLGGPVAGVSSKGLKWELNNASFSKDFLSISNICLNSSFHMEITTGDLLCILQTLKTYPL